MPAAEELWISTAKVRVQLAAHRGQVGGQQVGVLAHHAEGVQVIDHARRQVRCAQQLQRLRLLLGTERRGLGRLLRLAGLARLLHQRILQALQPQQHRAQLALERLLPQAQLHRGLAHEGAAAARGVQVQRVHEVGRIARPRLARTYLAGPHFAGPAPHLHVHAHRLRAEVLLPAADAPGAGVGVQAQFLGQVCAVRGGVRTFRGEQGHERALRPGRAIGRGHGRWPGRHRHRFKHGGGRGHGRGRLDAPHAPHPLRLPQHHGQRLSHGLLRLRHRGMAAAGMACVLVGILALREHHAPHLQARRDQLRRQLLGRLVAGGVAVVGDEHALDVAGHEARQHPGREALHPVDAGHVREAGAPEAHGVDQRLAQDHLPGPGLAMFTPPGRQHPGQVEHAALQRLALRVLRARQVQVLRGARAQLVQQLAPVHLHHLAGLRATGIEHRHHQRAVEVLVPAVADQPDAPQPRADRGAVLALLVRQPQPQRAVGHAQLEGVHQVRMVQPARAQVLQCCRALLEPLVVVVDGLVQQRAVIGIQRHRCGQQAHGAALGRGWWWRTVGSGRSRRTPGG